MYIEPEESAPADTDSASFVLTSPSPVTLTAVWEATPVVRPESAAPGGAEPAYGSASGALLKTGGDVLPLVAGVLLLLAGVSMRKISRARSRA